MNVQLYDTSIIIVLGEGNNQVSKGQEDAYLSASAVLPDWVVEETLTASECIGDKRGAVDE